MPIVEKDPWRAQYFVGVTCPEDIIIPTDDEEAYRLFPAHRWIYNKLLVCETQGLEHGPHGIPPSRFPVFSKPIYNLRGMGVGGKILRSREEYDREQAPGHLWMPVVGGEHVSSDVAVVDGTPVWWRHATGLALGDGTFDHWTVLAEPRPAIEAYGGEWCRRHLRGYSGFANLETIDGTIIDSIELILRSYRHTIALHRSHEPMPPDDMWIQGLGTPLWAQFGQITEDKEEIEAMVQTYRTYNLTHHDALVKPYEGVVDEIRRLKNSGKRLGVVTSKLRDGAMRGLRVSGLDDAFDVVIGCDDVTRAKPHPEPVLKAVAELGVKPTETVFVGDSRHDMESGRAAGVKTAAVLWGPFDRADLEDLSPDYWLEKPQDLRELYEP